jgi:DUF3068 family protein
MRERLRRPRKPRVVLRYLIPGAVLFVAAFLLFMAMLLPRVIAPRVARIPLAPSNVLVAEGYGSYFAPSQGQIVTSDQLTRTTTISGQPEAGSAEVAVWDTFSSLEDLRATVLPEARVLSEASERVALDRTTGQPVNCCGEDPVHEGLTHRFPFDTQPGEYLMWEPTLNAAWPASFTRTDRLGDLPVYVFACIVPPTAIGSETVPGRFVGSAAPSVDVSLVHAVDIEVWVEPRTGRIVHRIDDVRQTLEQPDGATTPYRTLRLAWNDDTIGEQVELAQRDVARLEGVSSTLPLAALVAGVILFAVGIILSILANSPRQDG